jgi:glycosyltransferase involved in cell wall biosynthesis
MGVAVVVPVKDKLSLTKSIVKQCHADPSVVDVLVIDNGSTDGTWGWLVGAGVESMQMPDAGIHEMWNAGIDWSLERHDVTSVAILNNDLELGDEALSRCDEALQKLPVLAAVCPNYDGREQRRGVQLTQTICANRYDGTGGLAGFAMVIAADWLSDGYRFPEECRWWYGDNDLVASALMNGRQSGIVLDATVVHLDGGGQTGNWTDPAMREILEADRAHFSAKWSGPDAPTYAKVTSEWSDIADHLPRFVDLVKTLDARKVIELGVRSGVSTVAWLEGLRSTGGRLWSVDIDPAPFAPQPQWTFIRGDDRDDKVLRQLPRDVDIVFVDTSHEYEHTVEEIAIYAQRLRPGGAMVFHDTEVENFGVKPAVAEWVERDGLDVKWYEDSYGLAVVTV